jgi:hypothetical protein
LRSKKLASVRMLAPDGTISTVAGGVSGFESNDSGPATSLPLYAPAGLVVDSADNLYIAEAECVRKVVAGIISTVAGQCGVNSGPSGDGGPATSAIVYRAQGIAMDAAGSLYIADTGNIDIRKVSNGTISSVSQYPANWLALDNAGNLFVTDAFYRVTKISSAADITIAGGGSYPLSSGISATSASLTSLGGLRVDSAGKITFADVSGVLVLTPLTGPPVASINPGGILNAASFSGGPLAPGSIATIFGNFGINATQAGGAPLPTVLSGVSIQMQTGSSISAPLFYASAGQVNLQIPWELAGQTSVPVSATLNGKSGPAQPLQLAPFAPGIFVVNRQGQVRS